MLKRISINNIEQYVIRRMYGVVEQSLIYETEHYIFTTRHCQLKPIKVEIIVESTTRNFHTNSSKCIIVINIHENLYA